MQRRVRAFTSDVPRFVTTLRDNRAFISGSLVLQSLIAETYSSSDMDVYCNCSNISLTHTNNHAELRADNFLLYEFIRNRDNPKQLLSDRIRQVVVRVRKLIESCPIAKFLLWNDSYHDLLLNFGQNKFNLSITLESLQNPTIDLRIEDVFENVVDNEYTKLRNHNWKDIDLIHPFSDFSDSSKSIYDPIMQTYYGTHVMNVWLVDFDDLPVIGSFAPRHSIAKIGIVIPPLEAERNLSAAAIEKYVNRGFLMVMFSSFNFLT